MTESRSIRLDALTRVEGEGALYVHLVDGRVERVELSIFEPPRLFEAFLRGRPLQDVVDITARICGICPVAYQMSSVHALEAALGIAVPPEIRRLRRLLYCGEWIESHSLHMHLLHAPDFLGYDSGMAMARDYPDEVRRGLALKKHGNRLLEVFGGRSVHPVSVAIGGFFRTPSQSAVRALVGDFRWGLEAAVAATRWVSGFEFPDFEQPWETVALSHPEEYAMNEGDVASSLRAPAPVSDFERLFAEYQVPYSTALQSVRSEDRRSYLVGPLARVNLNLDRLSSTARRIADEVGVDWPCRNPFKSIVARGLEVIHAYEEALAVLEAYEPVRPPRIGYQPREGEGCAATEAPRGLLFHRYRVDEHGRVEEAVIIPPTSQNQKRIEDDLCAYLPGVLGAGAGVDDESAAMACERLVRSYDPCISCSTHFLRMTLDRKP